jgi:hypothetical protein
VDDSRADTLPLILRKDLQFDDVETVGCRTEHQAADSLPILLDDEDLKYTEASVKVTPLPVLVPAPRLLNHGAHRLAVQPVQECSIRVRRRADNH